jgi:hypothetical protein
MEEIDNNAKAIVVREFTKQFEVLIGVRSGLKNWHQGYGLGRECGVGRGEGGGGTGVMLGGRLLRGAAVDCGRGVG